MDKIMITYDKTGNTLDVWFEKPAFEKITTLPPELSVPLFTTHNSLELGLKSRSVGALTLLADEPMVV